MVKDLISHLAVTSVEWWLLDFLDMRVLVPLLILIRLHEQSSAINVWKDRNILITIQYMLGIKWLVWIWIQCINKKIALPIFIIIIIKACRQHEFAQLSHVIQPPWTIALNKSLIQYPVSAQNWSKFLLVGHRRTLLMSSSLLLQQFLVFLTWKVCEIGGKWPYNFCSVVIFYQNLLKKACSFILYFSSYFFT